MRLAAALLLSAAVAAYPQEMVDFARRYPSALEKAQAVMRDRHLEDSFNATAQRVSTSGEHRFSPPKDSDLRGPCPGLNALANHGYIPRNGYATLYEMTEAVMEVFGMGSDLALFLTTYAGVVDGDMSALSIGEAPAEVLAAAAAGQTKLGDGISKSHNKLEADASPTRPDLYELRPKSRVPPHHARASYFQQLLSLQPNPSTANYDIPTLTTFRATRFHQSIKTNPFFFHGPFTGLLIQPKSYTFAYRLFANHSREFPAGRLDRDTLKSFFAMTTTRDGKLSYKAGHERIPNQWYRRSAQNPYDAAFFLGDVLYQASRHPEFLAVGGNVGGKADTFTGVDLNKLTRGVYGAGAGGVYDFACLAYQSALLGAPSMLSHKYDDGSVAMDALRQVTLPLIEELGCPALKKLDEGSFKKFEGFNRAGGVY